MKTEYSDYVLDRCQTLIGRGTIILIGPQIHTEATLRTMNRTVSLLNDYLHRSHAG